MSLARLRLIALALPAAFVLVAELGLAPRLEVAFPLFAARLLIAVVLLAGVAAFTLAIFRVLEDKERTILAQARQARTLHQVGAEVSALLDVERLVAVVVERARELLEADAAGLARVDSDGGTLYWRHFVAGDTSGEGFRAIRLRMGEGIAGRVVATGQPLMLPDVADGLPPGLESAPILEADHLRSALAVPLRSGDHLLGALMVANKTPRVFRDHEIALLESLANQVAVALANAELYARVQVTAERLERLIENSADGIITVDLQGRILTWNQGAGTIYGWSREEATGAVLPMVPPDLIEDARGIMRRMVDAGETLINYETERLRKDGGRIPVVVTATAVRNSGGEVVALLGISKDMSAHRQVEEQARKLALLEDRERIGMELHDGAIQSLYAVGLGLDAVGQVLETDPSLAHTRLAQARDAVHTVIQEIRNYVVGLRPDTFARHGLVAGLAELAEELRVNALVDLEVDVAEEAGPTFSAEQAQEIFQVAREALANVTRHAGASRASLSLRTVDGRWHLRVWDNGVGFDSANLPRSGMGLRNMRERARRLGAEMEVTSAPRAGTEVHLALAGAEGGRP